MSHSMYTAQGLIEQCPDIPAHKDGREVVLVFAKHVATILKKARESTYDNDCMILSKVAKLIR